MKKRTLLRALACSAVAAGHRIGLAQHYPGRPIRLFVGYSPGGQTDQIARLVADSLTKLLPVAVVVENRPGANGAIAVEAVRRAPADGYALVVAGNGTLTLTPLIQDDTNYDALRDFIPIARVAHVPLVLAVRSDLPIRTVAQLLDHARRQPGAVSCAVSGSAARMAVEFLNATVGVDLMIVPYKGNAPAILDVVAGRADSIIADVASVRSHVQAGTLRLIANLGGRADDSPTCQRWSNKASRTSYAKTGSAFWRPRRLRHRSLRESRPRSQRCRQGAIFRMNCAASDSKPSSKARPSSPKPCAKKQFAPDNWSR